MDRMNVCFITEKPMLLMYLNWTHKCQTQCMCSMDLTSTSVSIILISIMEVFYLNPNLDLYVESTLPLLYFKNISNCKKSMKRQ